MAKPRIYLDNNATMPLRPQARSAMLRALDEGGNASSVHAQGRAARQIIETARRQVSRLVNAAPADVIFTSCGTESNNQVISSAVARGTQHILISAVEHPAVSQAARASGANLEILEVDSNGRLAPQTLSRALEKISAKTAPAPVLVSIMLANNETGVLQPIAELAQIAHEHGALFHTDAVQGAGKLALDMPALGVDFLSLSAHKIGGPQGSGALIIRPSVAVEPFILGGGQERARRAGTENLSGIAGFGAAAQAALEELEDMSRIKGLRDLLEDQIQAFDSSSLVLGKEAERLDNTCFFATAGVKAETLVIALDLEGIAISAGSACSSGKASTSFVPLAMGFDEDLASSMVRVSFGWQNTRDDITGFMDGYGAAVKRMRSGYGQESAA
ncbi:MAG TPA: cysteine desulfurase [Rhizobiales bacterium]|nr:cysteine desulfurase [Hyphomicrobiales bacterium]